MRKYLFLCCCIWIAILTLIFSLSAHATSWEDFLQAVDTQNFVLHDDTNLYQGKVHRAIVTYRITDGNNNGELERTEHIYLKVQGNGKVVQTPGSGLTKDQLIDWAKDRADLLLKIIFGDDPSPILNGQSTSIQGVTSFFDAILTVGGQRSSRGNKYLKILKKTSYSSLVVLRSERADIEVEDSDGNAIAGFLKLQHMFGNNNVNTLGVVISYRINNIDDKWDTDSAHVVLMPFFSKYFSLSPRLEVRMGINLQGGIFYSDSKAFPDGIGYLEYGGGIFLVPIFHITQNFSFETEFGYQYNKKYAPLSLIPDDLKFIAEAINDLDASNLIVVGGRFQFEPVTNLKFTTGSLYTKELTGDFNIDEATYYYASVEYIWKRLILGAGYKIVRDAPGYDEDAYMVHISLKW